MITAADVVGYDGRLLTLRPDDDILREIIGKNVTRVEISLDDGRLISSDQRKKIFAIIGDISKWCGHDPEYLRQMLTWDFRGTHDIPAFSLSRREASAADMTTAREFVDYLIDFCLYHGVPASKPLADYAEDVDRYLYHCLEHRRCAVCGRRAEVHHVDRVGMGRDREAIVHEGLRAVALCREHHEAAHRGEGDFLKLYHIHGIPLDRYLCQRLNLNKEEKTSEQDYFAGSAHRRPGVKADLRRGGGDHLHRGGGAPLAEGPGADGGFHPGGGVAAVGGVCLPVLPKGKTHPGGGQVAEPGLYHPGGRKAQSVGGAGRLCELCGGGRRAGQVR